jgi:hypothetical protein
MQAKLIVKRNRVDRPAGDPERADQQGQTDVRRAHHPCEPYWRVAEDARHRKHHDHQQQRHTNAEQIGAQDENRQGHLNADPSS